MSRQARAAVTAMILLGVTAWALHSFVDVSLEDQPGIRMALPTTLGGWTGHELRFCHNPECRKEFRLENLTNGDTCPACASPLRTMTIEEYEALPKDTEFIKSIYESPTGETLYVSIVLTGRDRESIHRPERCLVGQGRTIRSRTVHEIPIPNRDPLGTMVFLNEMDLETPQGAIRHSSFFAYWFVGQGRETPDHYMRMFWLAWDRVVNSVAHRWAYISISGMRDPESDAHMDRLRDFIPRLHEVLTP